MVGRLSALLLTSRKATQRRLSLGADDAEAEEAPATPSAAPPVSAPEARSVSEVVHAVKSVLGEVEPFQGLWVGGEVSNFKAAPSGHWYFTLKDEGAQLKCAMFRGRNQRVPFEPEDGMQVLARGDVSVYAQRGELQLSVSDLRADGVGDLAAALDQLKRRLAAEGLFDDARKRSLPRLPLSVGVVTSGGGAVWHDIRNVARRRFPGITLILAPVRVQGAGAAEEVAEAIARFNRSGAVDVLIVGRGGGSLEDLWAFNEEAVVRAIVGSRLPVVSAVGHETDFTLADFAADVRAATPSQAAEFVTPYEAAALVQGLLEAERRLARSLSARATRLRERYDRAARHPALTRAERLLGDRERRTDEAWARFARAMRVLLDRKKNALGQHAAALEALSPLGVLSRGYALASGRTGTIVRSVTEVSEGDELTVRLSDGRVKTKITEVTPDDEERDDV